MAWQRGSTAKGPVSVRPRADGLWVARYTVVEDGVTRRPVLYGQTRAEAARRLRAALVARDDALKSRVAKEIVEDSSAVRHEDAHPPRPESVDPRGARRSTRYIRIADVTPGGMREVWIHPNRSNASRQRGNRQRSDDRQAEVGASFARRPTARRRPPSCRSRGRLGAAAAARTSVQSSGAGPRRLRVGRDQTDQRQAHSRVSNRDSMVLNPSVIPMEDSCVISWR